MSTLKKLYIKTYGCQMNVYDSEQMARVLKPHGYELSDTPEGASLILLNTCHIREKAAEKVYSELGRLKEHKSTATSPLIAVAGCVAQAEGAEIIRRAPYVDIVLGPQTYHRLPEMIERAKRVQQLKANDEPFSPVIDTDFPVESKFDFIPQNSDNKNVSAFLTIQEGCDKFCSFCCVPYTRGMESSRPMSAITREAIHLVSQGVKEITLLGQNVTAYHGQALDKSEESSISQLIYHLSKIQGLERLRYTTSHPRDMNAALIQAHKDCEKLMPFLHLPVQSGSNRILQNMNRQHTRERYMEIIEALRYAQPDLALSSDFIVGYPGETDQDFEDTLDLVRQVNFAQAYSFKYSPRPGTPASIHEDQVPEDVKDTRLQALQALLRSQQKTFNLSKIGQTLPVLFERKGRHAHQYIGRSPYMQSVHTTFSEDMIGKICHIKVSEASLNSLGGTVSMAHEAA